MYKTARRALTGLATLAGALTFAASAHAVSFVPDPGGTTYPACTPFTPVPSGPVPPDGHPHAVVCSSTSLHMGDVEYRLQSDTFYDYCTNRAVVGCFVFSGNVLAWVGSWNTRPLKPVPGQPREVYAEMYWYNYPYDLQICHYSGVYQGTDLSMTLESGTGLFLGCT